MRARASRSLNGEAAENTTLLPYMGNFMHCSPAGLVPGSITPPSPHGPSPAHDTISNSQCIRQPPSLTSVYISSTYPTYLRWDGNTPSSPSLGDKEIKSEEREKSILQIGNTEEGKTTHESMKRICIFLNRFSKPLLYCTTTMMNHDDIIRHD